MQDWFICFFEFWYLERSGFYTNIPIQYTGFYRHLSLYTLAHMYLKHVSNHIELVT